jgi:hypothetical protein
VTLGDRLDLFRRTAASLTSRRSEQGIVVAVDDAHLLDDAATALVLHLAI